MRLIAYAAADGPRAAVATDSGAHDAAGLLGIEEPVGVRRILAQGWLPRLEQAVSAGPGAADPGAVTPLAPIPDPGKIVCVGLNYRSHAAEAGIEPPGSPTIFAKYANAIAPPGATVALPAASAKVDFEAEVAFVVGSRAKEVPVERADEHVAGYMLFNDLSARDLQFATPQWMPGKVFDGSAPCGPALVTPEEAVGPDGIGIELRLNGELMQSATTSDLIFPVPELLSHLSTLMTLEPGDIVATGTPSGVGSVRKPRVWLADGDEIVIESPTLGRLETAISR